MLQAWSLLTLLLKASNIKCGRSLQQIELSPRHKNKCLCKVDFPDLFLSIKASIRENRFEGTSPKEPVAQEDFMKQSRVLGALTRAQKFTFYSDLLADLQMRHIDIEEPKLILSHL